MQDLPAHRIQRIPLVLVVATAALLLTACTARLGASAAPSQVVSALPTVEPANPSALASASASAVSSATPASADVASAPAGPPPVLVPTFVYHYVTPNPNNDLSITPALFEAQLAKLKQLGYTPITAAQYADALVGEYTLPDKPVMLTFDDGWKSQYQYVAPILKRHGFSATFFVYPKMLVGGGFMTKSQIKELSDQGFDIESHTWGHVHPERRSGETTSGFLIRMKPQMVMSKNWIRQVTGHDPKTIAYPGGLYDTATQPLLEKYGYAAGFTCDLGSNVAGVTPSWLLKRFIIGSDSSLASFSRQLTSKAMELRGATPPPGTRVAARTALIRVSVPTLSNLNLYTPGHLTALKQTRAGQRTMLTMRVGGHRGFHPITVVGTNSSGQRVYASWAFVFGN